MCLRSNIYQVRVFDIWTTYSHTKSSKLFLLFSLLNLNRKTNCLIEINSSSFLSWIKFFELYKTGTIYANLHITNYFSAQRTANFYEHKSFLNQMTEWAFKNWWCVTYTCLRRWRLRWALVLAWNELSCLNFS